MAQLFEEAIWSGDGFWIGHVQPRRVRQLQNDLLKNRLIDFGKLLGMSQETWAENLSGGADLGATQYNQCWAMVQFLTFSQNEKGESLHRKRLVNMLRLLHEGKAGDTAFREAFSANIRGFQDRFTEYASALQATPTATLIERQSVLGDLLWELDKRGLRFQSITQQR